MGSYLYLCEVYHMQCDSNSKRSKWWVYAVLEYFPHWRETEAVTSISCVYLTDICLQNSPTGTNSNNTLRSVSCIHRDEAEKTACGRITLSSVCWTVLSCVLLVACNSTVILSTSWYESEVINMSNFLLKCQCGASTCGLQKRHLPTFLSRRRCFIFARMILWLVQTIHGRLKLFLQVFTQKLSEREFGTIRINCVCV